MALLKNIGIKSIIQAVTVMRNSWCLFGLAGQMKMTSEDQETSSRFSGDYEKCPSLAIHCQRLWANTLDSDRLGWQTQAMRLCLLGHSRAESVWASVQGPAVVHETRWGAERTKWKVFRVVNVSVQSRTHQMYCSLFIQQIIYTSWATENGLWNDTKQSTGPLQTEVQGQVKLAWHVLCCRM